MYSVVSMTKKNANVALLFVFLHKIVQVSWYLNETIWPVLFLWLLTGSFSSPTPDSETTWNMTILMQKACVWCCIFEPFSFWRSCCCFGWEVKHNYLVSTKNDESQIIALWWRTNTRKVVHTVNLSLSMLFDAWNFIVFSGPKMSKYTYELCDA